MLSHGMDIDWRFNYQEKYKRLFREKGVATVQGVADYDVLVGSFNDYWGLDFLESLYSATSETRDWIGQIQEARLIYFKPIYHVLLMCFLKGSVKAFVECEPSENPFGEGPWPCQNPICRHYHIERCQNTEIRYGNGVATGFFQCDECGMIYKQVKRKGKTGDILIVDYGPVWKDELLCCLGTEKMTIAEAAEVLKCEPHVVRWQKKRMGLSRKREYLKAPRRYDDEIGAESYYKSQVLELCAQYNEVTIALLREHAPGAYSYFSKHDFSWLRERMVYEKDCASQRGYDRKLLKKIQGAVEQIRKGGDVEKRLTIGYIANVVGVKENELRNAAQKRPLTKTFLDTVIESRTDWLRRRITMIWQNQKQAGMPLSLADVKREMSIKPNTYVEYKNLIEELVNELNGKNE